MSLGHRDKNYRAVTRESVYGQDGTASVTALAFTLEGVGLSFITWNPGFPSAVRATRVHVTCQVAGDTVPGNWTLSLYKNESLSASATFSFAASTTLTGTAGKWSSEVIFQAGDRYYVAAAGPEKNTVIARVTLEFELI